MGQGTVHVHKLWGSFEIGLKATQSIFCSVLVFCRIINPNTFNIYKYGQLKLDRRLGGMGGTGNGNTCWRLRMGLGLEVLGLGDSELD